MSTKKPKNKKEAQRQKNKDLFINFLQHETLMDAVDIAAPVVEKVEPAPAPSNDGGDGTWLQKREIMARSIDERRKRSRDRWSKSAFASGSGGRAR